MVSNFSRLFAGKQCRQTQQEDRWEGLPVACSVSTIPLGACQLILLTSWSVLRSRPFFTGWQVTVPVGCTGGVKWSLASCSSVLCELCYRDCGASRPGKGQEFPEYSKAGPLSQGHWKWTEASGPRVLWKAAAKPEAQKCCNTGNIPWKLLAMGAVLGMGEVNALKTLWDRVRWRRSAILALRRLRQVTSSRSAWATYKTSQSTKRNKSKTKETSGRMCEGCVIFSGVRGGERTGSGVFQPWLHGSRLLPLLPECVPCSRSSSL